MTGRRDSPAARMLLVVFIDRCDCLEERIDLIRVLPSIS